MSKRVLIYGFNTYTGSSYRGGKVLTFARILEAAYKNLGYEVTLGYPSEGVSEENLLAYDKVFIGLASPNSLGSDRAYVGLYMMGHLWNTDKLVLFFDDPDIRKFFYGVANWLQDPVPAHIFRPVFQKRKLWYDPAIYPADAARWTDWHINVLDALIKDSAEDYPPVIIPGFQWFDLPRFAANIPGAMRDRLQPIDPSPMIHVSRPADGRVLERRKEWAVDGVRSARKDEIGDRVQLWIQYQPTIFPVTAMDWDVTDFNRTQAYYQAWGTIVNPMPPTSIGWWSKDMTYAIRCESVFITDPAQVIALGPSFNLLAASTEHLSMEERDDLAAEQSREFNARTWSADQLKTALKELI